MSLVIPNTNIFIFIFLFHFFLICLKSTVTLLHNYIPSIKLYYYIKVPLKANGKYLKLSK